MLTPAASPTREEIDARPPIPGALLALAPLHLPNRRTSRYIGDNLCFPIKQLVERDQALLQHIYKVFSELLFTIGSPSTDDAEKWREVVLWTQRHNVDTLIDEVRELGTGSQSQDAPEALAKSMHDVRGGALSSLLGRLQLIGHVPQTEAGLQILFILARDHLKIMRSAFLGLDDPRRDADRRPKSHDVSLIIEKWNDAVVGPKWQERPTRMFVDCRHQGALTECCLESAALDRIFYNLANNACRHTAGNRLDMTIFPTGDTPDACLRFVLSNEVGAEDAAYLRSLLPTDGADSADKGKGLSLLALFEPKVSTTGSGFGLTVVADFVAGAFGLRDRAEALRERYLGAILDDHSFRVWFHWPIANNNLPAKLDDFHRLQQSLSEP